MDELKENIQRLWRSAELLFKDEDYTSATILYFKCLFGIMDLIIYQKLRLIPKDHTQRFEILKVQLPPFNEGSPDKEFKILYWLADFINLNKIVSLNADESINP